jgi:hypothetical protein
MPILPRFLLRRLLRQQKPRLRRLKKLWLRLIRNKPNVNKLWWSDLTRFACPLAVSASSYPCVLLKFTSVNMLLLNYLYFCDAVEKLGEVWNFGKEVPKTLCWTRWMCWSQTGSLLEMSSSKLAMF